MALIVVRSDDGAEVGSLQWPQSGLARLLPSLLDLLGSAAVRDAELRAEKAELEINDAMRSAGF